MIDVQTAGYIILFEFSAVTFIILTILLLRRDNSSNNMNKVEQTILADKQCADCIHCIYNVYSTDCDTTGYATSLGRRACCRFEKGGSKHGYYRQL